ncbi:MAG: fibronectin type III domain-containing protein [Actinomycetota bacterium]|nr:fibronectin type III domain-containing protein [Actinomycetota bacterium]
MLAAVVLLTGGGFSVRALAHDEPVPLAPRGLAAVDTASEMISLEWKPVALADSYEVVVSDGAAMAKHRTYRSTTPAVQIPGLQESTKYFVKVRGVSMPTGEEKNPGKYSSVASVETAEAKFPALVPPTGFHTTTVESATIDFVWDPIIKSKFYEMQYAVDKDFAKPRTVKVDAEKTTARIRGLEPENRLFVRLRAQGIDGKVGRFSETLEVRTIVPTEEIPIRVASYNIRCHSCGGASWSRRRTPVANTIAAQSPDVIGLQEAAQSRPGGFGTSQFEDLRALVTSTGTEYRVTQPAIAASQGTRILYKPSKVVMLDAGSVRYSNQKGGQNLRYFAWAIFRQRSTGQEFFFASTHLQPGKDSSAVGARNGQVRQLINSIPQLNPKKYPTLMVGDFNDYQYLNFTVQSLMRQAGYIDSLGIQYRSRVPAKWATVEKRIHTNYDSFNDGKGSPPVGTGNPNFNGTYLDYIFMSPMKVKSFENLINARSGIPSDHNMIRADVVLPY